MSDKTGIEWTDATWNPVTGCTEVSPGCDHCYAKTFAERWRGTAGHYFEHGFDVQLRPDKLNQPLRWKKPRKIFVNSMSDLFHDQVPDEYIAQVFAVMAAAPQHTFQILTKRHARMRSLLTRASFPELVTTWAWRIAPNDAIRQHRVLPLPLSNVWLGVSAENQQWADIRIPALLDTPAAVRFISAEPLLGPISLSRWITRYGVERAYEGHQNMCGVGSSGSCSVPWCTCPCHVLRTDKLHWVIAGGESGHGARPMHPDWVRTLREQCDGAGIAFLFKQWGEWAPGRIIRNPAFSGGAYFTGECVGGNPAVSLPYIHDFGDGIGAHRLTKKAAGRELDGRTWDQYPAAVVR